MDVTGLLIFLLLVFLLPIPAIAVHREFHFVNLLKNWTEAQSYCREKFSDLVTMENADDWARVSELVRNSGHPEAWIGLYDDVNNWRWSLDNTSLHEQDLGSWFDFVPDNADSNELCAKLFGGKLVDRPCHVQPNFVCYDEPSNSYIPLEIKETWQAAQSHCRQAYTDLTSIRNQQELNAIKSVLPSDNYWVGLYREGWKWSDQSSSDLREWGPGEPSGGSPTCGTAAVGGWNAVLCSLEHPFICSVPQMKVMRVTLKTDGSVDLNDPLVQEALVKQIQKDVRAPGVHQEFRLRWRKQSNGAVFNKTEL